jgi:hypothetical protein
MRLLLVIALAGCLHHDGDAVSCTGASPAFPAFDKSCERADECFVAFHTVSCCGTQVAIGLSNVERDRFAADEAVCDSQYPACGCAQGPTQAEDGNTAIDNNQIVVQCTPARQCSTAVLMP